MPIFTPSINLVALSDCFEYISPSITSELILLAELYHLQLIRFKASESHDLGGKEQSVRKKLSKSKTDFHGVKAVN